MTEQLQEIINIFTEYKFEKCIYTNASLITLEVARFLKNRNIKLEISLYGMSPETYEAITGKAENYYKVMNALDYLKEEKIEFKLKATFTKQNFHERDKINKFIELMNSESPAQVARLMGNHSGVVDMRLDDEEMISILKTDLYLENEEFLPYGTCSGGITQYCIRPNGDMTPCLGFHSIIMGNILKNPYREIIEKFSLNRELNCKEITCNTCDKTKFCSPCPMIFYQDTGSHLKVSQESCRIAALKQQVHNERALEESNLCVNQN
ncbi:MAG: radical SAM protein [Cellulosilyticaceae bacterium]